MHALEQQQMDIFPTSISVGQALALHLGFASLKTFFKKFELDETQFEFTWD